MAIIAGHDEYITRAERRNLTNYVQDGGKLIILGGNTCWIQARYLNNQKTIVCYRKFQYDPYFNNIDSLVTVEWRQYPLDFPENSLTGVSFANAGYVNSYNKVRSFLPWSEGYGGYTAINTYNWIYKGTNLVDGDIFGYNEAIVGNETDGALYQWSSGIPKVKGTDMTPNNFLILGISPAANWDNYTISGRQATMGMYFTNNNGAVFNASTLRWCNGLDSSAVVQIITRNIVQKFLSNKFPPEIISWSPYRVFADTINQEYIYLNKRSVIIPFGKSRKFRVNANDLFKEPLSYEWTLNGKIVSTDTTFKFAPDSLINSKENLISVNVFNAHDTSTISWEVYSKPIKILSKPHKLRFALKDKLYYKIESADYFQNSVDYKLISGPSWLTLNNDGILSGIIAKTGDYNISVRVDDSLHNFDIQNFTVKVDSILTLIESPETEKELTYKLFQNYPNPFNPSTVIKFQVEGNRFITIKIFDILGREVSTLVNDYKTQGTYSVLFDASKLASGVYFCQLKSDNYTSIKKMILLK